MRLGNRKVTLPGLFATVGTLALLLSACGGSSAATNTPVTGPAKGANQKMIIYWPTGGGTQDVATLDPAQAQDSGSIPIVNTIFDQLVTLDANLKPELWGADKVTPSADGLSYVFHIRSGQKFSDGTPVKASDYAFAVNRSANPCEASPVAGYLSPIKDAAAFIGETCGSDGKTVVGAIQTLIGDSIVADDSASTLTFTLAAPAGYFEEALTYSTASAVEQSALGDGLGADGSWLANLTKPMGNSGMFNVKTWDHAGNLVLVPNPNWWGVSAGKKPTFTEIDYKLFADADVAYNTYESDPTAATIPYVPTAQVATAKSDSDYHENSILLFNGFAMNYKIKPFDNKDARLAFCEVINRDSIAHNIAKDLALPTFNIVPKGMPGYNPDLKGPDGIPTAGDLSKAQAHWTAYKATLNGAPIPSIKLSYNLGNATQKTTAEYYQSTFSSAFGLNVQIDQTAWPTILEEENAKTVQLFRFAWLADYPDPQDFLTLLFDTTAPYNNWNASVPAADQLMEAADQLFLPSDQNKRIQDYQQAEQLLIDDGAFCPTTTNLNFYKLRPWVYGMSQTAQASFVNDMWVNGYLTDQEPSA